MSESSFESEYEKGTIEHQLQPSGGRDLAIYEAQLMFNRKDLEGKIILDLGAGPEVKFAKQLEESGIKAEVVSSSPDFAETKYAEKARESLPDGKLAASIGQGLSFKNKSFDRVFAFHVDEHLSRQAFFGLISEMVRVLKEGGEAKLGPTRNIPNEWYPYEAVLDNKELLGDLNDNTVSVIKEPIPEEVIPKTRVKDSYGGRFEEPSFNIVLRKSTQPIHEPHQD